jgi:hypothetical protein
MTYTYKAVEITSASVYVRASAFTDTRISR